jgi:aspartyl protease family protein
MNSMLKPAVTFVVIGLLVSWCASGAGTGQMSDVAETKSRSGRTHRVRHQAPGGDVTLRRAGNGHFYADAEVNGTSVRMLADTGASIVVLGEDDAESVGLDPDSLDYSQSVSTANGRASAAVVTLDELRVGSIVRQNVRALVTKGLSGSLLGMSFFNTLSQVSMESDELVLKD